MPDNLGLREIKRADLPRDSPGDKKRPSIFRHRDCRRPQPPGPGIGPFSRRLGDDRAAVLPCRPETTRQQKKYEV